MEGNSEFANSVTKKSRGTKLRRHLRSSEVDRQTAREALARSPRGDMKQLGGKSPFGLGPNAFPLLMRLLNGFGSVQRRILAAAA